MDHISPARRQPSSRKAASCRVIAPSVRSFAMSRWVKASTPFVRMSTRVNGTFEPRRVARIRSEMVGPSPSPPFARLKN